MGSVSGDPRAEAAPNDSPADRAPGPGLPPGPGWRDRLDLPRVLLLIALIAAVLSLPALRGSGRDLDYAANFLRFAGRFFPPDFSVLGQAVRSLWETFQIAVMATLFAVLISLPLGAAGAQTLAPRWLVWGVRFLMNAIRTLPSLIWALLAVAVVGPNPLAGVIGLTFYSIGYLAKFFGDAFESVDPDVARGLRAMGASGPQAFQYGLWPHARPLVWSYALWMLEYNLRSAAIIGYVGAGGIGTLLHVYHEYYEWDKFATVLLLILALVTLLDLCGESLRRRIAKRPSARPLAG